MTRDEEAPPSALFDRRIVERNIKRGLTTRKDYEKYLKSLVDVAGKIKAPDEDQAPEGAPAEGAGVPEPTPNVNAG